MRCLPTPSVTSPLSKPHNNLEIVQPNTIQKTKHKQNKVGPKQREKLKNLEEKLIKVQDLFIDGDLTKEEYQNHKKIIENLINEAKDRQIQFSKKKEVFDLYKNGLKSMQNIENQYIKSDVEFKRRFVGSIFPEKFQFENKKVRTADINPILHKIAQFNSVNQENKKRDKSQKQDLSWCVDNSFEISNIGFTPRDILYTIKSINFILEIDFEK
jgi:hypothetical protein